MDAFAPTTFVLYGHFCSDYQSSFPPTIWRIAVRHLLLAAAPSKAMESKKFAAAAAPNIAKESTNPDAPSEPTIATVASTAALKLTIEKVAEVAAEEVKTPAVVAGAPHRPVLL